MLRILGISYLFLELPVFSAVGAAAMFACVAALREIGAFESVFAEAIYVVCYPCAELA